MPRGMDSALWLCAFFRWQAEKSHEVKNPDLCATTSRGRERNTRPRSSMVSIPVAG